ncbi:Hyphal_reg_CWP domain-containing protein [Caenorhabditis elegans]|uniref:Hyphal_reg_CWP domain-containing protein n=1 Tax=Caenorhabditis elegans TaxID=6239 RepID=P91370_CAEEL|nr:Hyphal_reg_CWP domain-containing protein [Caenorhabditis elegans]CCD70972.1 Hyphal_reg_CWP domain-containing protein [Caenorhabditis elegans]|eukprot:NP_499968.1 Uncharacterized protein CELE_K11H12.3 [Caenorhabditis elegans]
MSTVCVFLFLALTFSVHADPKVVYLYDVSSIEWLTIGVEGGGNIYLASGDDNQILKNIQLTTGSTSITLDQLNDDNDDGSAKFITATGSVTLQTSNNGTMTGKLSGYIYVTTYLQARDPTFSVYVLKTTQSISKMGMKSTVVVLNTVIRQELIDYDMPRIMSYVSSINHTRIQMYIFNRIFLLRTGMMLSIINFSKIQLYWIMDQRYSSIT